MMKKTSFEKGKPAERLGRKATGLHSGGNRDRAAGLPGDDFIPPLPAGARHLPTGAAPKPASHSTPSVTTPLPIFALKLPRGGSEMNHHPVSPPAHEDGAPFGNGVFRAG